MLQQYHYHHYQLPTIVTITVTATATVTTSITFEDNRSKTIELIEIEHCVHKFHPKLHSNARQSRKMISKMCTTAHETHIKWINGTRAQIQIDCTKSIAGGGDNINKTVSLFNNFSFLFLYWKPCQNCIFDTTTFSYLYFWDIMMKLCVFRFFSITCLW